MKKLLITDGNSMLFRAYYATAYAGSRMTTSAGVPTNAVFAFANMMQKAIDMIEPDAIMVAFDAGKHTFRHDLYADYKGGRKPTPDDLVPQFQMVREYCDAYHIKWIEMENIEADDLIGTASDAFKEDTITTILTSDHDLLQLADEDTSILLMKKGITDMDVMTKEKIKEDMGIEPIQIIDMKGLMGDSSDNYPGIPGVGEKTALKLLNQYGSVEGVLEHENEIKGALGKKIIQGHNDALLSKKLATIKRDVKLPFTFEDLIFTPDYTDLVRFLHSLDMNKLASRYEDKINDSYVPEAKTVKKEISFSRVEKMPEEFLKNESYVFVDADTANFMVADIHGFALCKDENAYYISLENALKDETLLAYLKNDTPYKIGYDVKRNMHLLNRIGLPVAFHDDVMILASLCDSTLTSTEKIFDAYGLTTEIKYEDVYGKANKPVLFIDENMQKEYACASSMNIQKLYEETYVKLVSMDMEKLYREIELPLTKILYEMEKEGIRCDISVLDAIATDTFERIQTETKAIYEEAHREFNINSPKQLSEVLYDDLGLPSGKKRTTSAEKLESLSGIHPIIDHILTYRKLSKIYSTYAEGLKKYIQKDGKIHTIYNQCATQTGRLSSSEPNLQNISVRDEEGKQIRKAFKPEENCLLMSCDYHQIELRMLAHMANEENLIEAFQNGVDAHTKTAMDIFDVDQDEVTSDMRRKAKTVNFGVVYGISEFGLAKQMNISRFEAKDFIERYYEKFPGIRSYMDEIVKECEKNGYVTTICGRRREIPEIHSSQHMMREFGKRAAMNAPIQGSSADLIKIAMIRIDQMMKEKNVQSKMILQVHDELIFNVVNGEEELMKKIVEEGMNHAMELKVPLTSECAVGKDWYEAK